MDPDGRQHLEINQTRTSVWHLTGRVMGYQHSPCEFAAAFMLTGNIRSGFRRAISSW
jgi:hypothetical protein